MFVSYYNLLLVKFARTSWAEKLLLIKNCLAFGDFLGAYNISSLNAMKKSGGSHTILSILL